MERRIVDGEIVKLAREQQILKLHAEIYSFNTQSQRMFERAGFHKAGDELYEMELQLSNRKSARTVSGRFFSFFRTPGRHSGSSRRRR